MDKHIRVTNSVVAFTNGTAAMGFGMVRMKAVLMSGTGMVGGARGVVPFGLVLAVPCLFFLAFNCFFLGLGLVVFPLVLFLFFFSSKARSLGLWRFLVFSGVSRGNFSGDNKAAAADLAGFVDFFFFFLVVVVVVVLLLPVLGVCAVGVARWFLLPLLILDDAFVRVCEGLVLALC